MIALVALAEAAIARADASLRFSTRPVAVRSVSPVVHRTTPHLRLMASLSPDTLEPGTRATLAVSVTPNPGIHVYAPGSSYRPVSLTLTWPDAIDEQRAVYSNPTTYFFKPLSEQMLVYSRPFNVTLTFAVSARAFDTIASRGSSSAVAADLAYQACNHEVCYLPLKTRLEWKLRPISRRASGSAPTQ
jgi:hypothetical protein